ncbi:uncharacterized protein LOC129226673 [Uloborus diversus]|uniref:uncharacterized protein LOC129226673 n=1 Tax=Uloborus diversus TaxID=327109 RepID=UPI002409C941|nr:uncharacterized protein LOC129226673 [Uloborus diversus]
MPCNTPPPPAAIEDMDDAENDMEIIEEFELPEDESVLTFTEHEGSVFCCNLSKDASMAVSGGQDDRAFVWNTTNGEIKFECTDHKDSVIFAQFSPDDTYVATADMSGIVQVWNTQTKEKTWNFEASEITMMQWDAKENSLFAGTSDGSLWKWSIPDGDAKFSQASYTTISCGALLPNGKELVIGYVDGSVKFFETDNLSLVRSVTGENHLDNVCTVDCHKDNILVATGAQDGSMKVIKSTTGKVLWTANCHIPGASSSSGGDEESISTSVESVAFSESHPILATGTNKGYLAFWDVSSQTKRSCSQLTEEAIVKIIFAKNSPLLYTVTSGCHILLYDSRTAQLERKWEGHISTILDFDLSREIPLKLHSGLKVQLKLDILRISHLLKLWLLERLGIKWLDLLESEFDKAFVDLDLLIGEIDEDQIDIVYAARQKLTALSTAFAQLSHKSQVVCESSMKLEKELADAKQGLLEAETSRSALQKELQHLLLQLHSAQLQVSAQMGHADDSETIKQKLENEMEYYRTNIYKETFTETQVQHLKKENEILKLCNVALQSEVFGSRLAAKYLDKELAGRIQQIQLLGKDIKGSDHDRLWEQLEAEIHLHRHKTVIRACRAQRGIGCKLLAPPGHDFHMLRKKQGVGEVRIVTLTKGADEGLGISITGGKEHGVPIVVSEIHPYLPASRSGLLYVGDAILSVNGIDLRNLRHVEAAKVLSSQQGQITMEVVFVAPDEDWSDGQGNADFSFNYPFYEYNSTSLLTKFMNRKTTDRGTDPIETEDVSTEEPTASNKDYLLNSSSNSSKCIENGDCAENICAIPNSSIEMSSREEFSGSPKKIDSKDVLNSLIPDRNVLNDMWRSLMFEKNKHRNENEQGEGSM